MSVQSTKAEEEITEYLTKTRHYNVERIPEKGFENKFFKFENSGDENDHRENSENDNENENKERKYGPEVDGDTESCEDVTIILSTFDSRFMVDIENSFSKLNGKQYSFNNTHIVAVLNINLIPI